MTLDKVQPGLSHELKRKVTKSLTTNRIGRAGDDVLSTPSMLDLMEKACIMVTETFLPKGSATVGYAVDGLRHLAPTPIGERVRVSAVLTQVEGNRLTYSVEAFEGDKKIGVATHKRAVIFPEA